MRIPGATYRLQLRQGVDFARAAQIVPYLARLGISHLYLSPPFAARAGSTHGYDVVDPNRLDPALGGDAGFEALARTTREHGLGLILDIVPNHMGIGPDNPWWWDVLRHGRASAFASYFDIDFERDPDGKLVLPVLGGSLQEVAARGELEIDHTRGTHLPVLRYFQQSFPLTLAGAPPGEALDPDAIVRLMDAQPYRLVSWKEGAHRRNYRRFFNIDELAGLRVEEPEVFEASHRLILDLVAKGVVDGLRIDHVDGLTDPKAYLVTLQRRIGEVRGTKEPFYLLVEKILTGPERLPEDWPVAGTTGYEFMNEVVGWLVAPQGLTALDALLQAQAGEGTAFPEVVRAAKGQVLDELFAGELETLAKRAGDLFHVPPERARLVLREFLMAFPVYRTYGDGAGWQKADLDVLDRTFATAQGHLDPRTKPLLEKLEGLLAEPASGGIRTLVIGLQQLSGPVMAKSVEDTAFYRYPRLLALNEVGGEPDAEGLDTAAMHRLAEERRRHWPGSLLATATHDTKRGEDARARLAVLSELPDAWAEQLGAWHDMTAELRHAASPALHAKDVYTLYQALVGVWPLELAPDDRAGLAALADRVEGWQRKALREGKERSRWESPDEAYENAMFGFLHALLEPGRAAGFLPSLHAFVHRIAAAGAANGLSQLLLKLTLPGVPDIYQGTERWDLSLVDPDNRRPVDFEMLAQALEAPANLADLLARWQDGHLKQAIMHRLLQLRAELPDVLIGGGYQPVEVVGRAADHVMAFARQSGDRMVIAAATRHLGHWLDGRDRLAPPSGAWGDTALVLPSGWEGTALLDRLGGNRHQPAEGRLPLAQLLTPLPIAVLLRAGG